MEQDSQIDFRSLALALWVKKGWIIAITLSFAVLGLARAMLSTKYFYSEAIITPKSGSGAEGRQGMLSQLGGLGLVASQLGVGNTNLDYLEVMLKSRGLAEMVITDNELLPRLFRSVGMRRRGIGRPPRLIRRPCAMGWRN